MRRNWASSLELLFLLELPLDLHIIAEGLGHIRYRIFGGGGSGTLQNVDVIGSLQGPKFYSLDYVKRGG